MEIQWFPGHMKDTETFLKKAVNQTDVVMEILDARLPVSSANPFLDRICKNRPLVKILNKKDLADPLVTQEWLNYFKENKKTAALAISGTNSKDAWRAADFCMKQSQKGTARRVRLMVVGIPNTGKSTIMNTLAGKKIARTGNVPAITRHQQRTALRNKADLYDTPGILWPVLEDQKGAFRLAASGAISDTAIDYLDVACFTARFLIARYPDLITERYGLSLPLPDSGEALLKAIGARRGCLKKGGILNFQKASEILIRELRAGKIGKISLETPFDLNTNMETDTQ